MFVFHACQNRDLTNFSATIKLNQVTKVRILSCNLALLKIVELTPNVTTATVVDSSHSCLDQLLSGWRNLESLDYSGSVGVACNMKYVKKFSFNKLKFLKITHNASYNICSIRSLFENLSKSNVQMLHLKIGNIHRCETQGLRKI